MYINVWTVDLLSLCRQEIQTCRHVRTYVNTESNGMLCFIQSMYFLLVKYHNCKIKHCILQVCYLYSQRDILQVCYLYSQRDILQVCYLYSQRDILQVCYLYSQRDILQVCYLYSQRDILQVCYLYSQRDILQVCYLYSQRDIDCIIVCLYSN